MYCFAVEPPFEAAYDECRSKTESESIDTEAISSAHDVV